MRLPYRLLACLVCVSACGGSSSSDDLGGGVDAATEASTGDLGRDGPCTDDEDADGHRAMACGGDDCDDHDAARFPGNTETCDAIDQDCDPATLGPDADLDGFPAAACCNPQPAGAPLCGDDCDDTSHDVSPTAPESCNGVDDDCDGSTDEGLLVACYADADGDGYATLGSAAAMLCACGAGTTATSPSTAADCDDANVHASPGASEVCDGFDDDCDGAVDEVMGAPCTSGLGACAVDGFRRCDGSCDAVALTASDYHDAPAANGSWDWNCDGTTEREIVPLFYDAAGAGFCGGVIADFACGGGSRYVHVYESPSTPAPYCGVPSYEVDPTLCVWTGSCVPRAPVTPTPLGPSRCR